MYFRWNSFDDLFSKRNSCPVQIFFLLQVTIVKSSSVSEPHPLFVECNTGDKNPCLPILCKRRKRILFDSDVMSNEEIIKKAAGEGKVSNWGIGNQYEIQALLAKYGLPTDYLSEDFTMDAFDDDPSSL